ILFPVFAQAREKARSINCLSNSRQLGTAIQMYVNDNDEAFPCSCMLTGAMNMSDMVSWLDTVQPYIKSRLLYRCPSATSPLWSDAMNPRRTSYGLNGYFIPIEPPYFGIRLAQINHPAECVVVGELADNWPEDFFQPMYWGDPPKVADSNM